MANNTYIQDWVTDRMMRGLPFFSRADIMALGLSIKEQSINQSLSRMIKRGVIASPWHNFYVTVPTEYRLKGLHPTYYIDQLMQFLDRKYYLSHLTAAAFNGASHQQAMVFQLMVDGGPIQSKVMTGVRVEFTRNQHLLLDFCQRVKTQTGYITVAGPELTALDVVDQPQKVGGLSRAAELLIELCEATHWDESKRPLLQQFSTATIQRLGYLLNVIEDSEQEEAFYLLAKTEKKVFRKVSLKQSVPVDETMTMDKRWNIIKNYEIEIDEI